MGQITDSAWIQTVRGLIPAQDLGFCHAHEHLFTSHDHAARIDPALLLDSYERTLAELELFKRAGGRGVVDAQPVGCGRRADLLQRASEASGVHVIASTGFHKLIYYPGDHWLHTASEEVLCELFLTELTEGMFLDGDHAFPRQKSSIRAGVIKAASDSAGITPEYLRLFTAAGLAAKQTGVSVLTHTEKGAGALEQVELLLDLGLAPESIIVSHLDRGLDDFSYHVTVAQTGVYLQYDTIGRPKYHSDREEAEHILRMVEAGFAAQILLGLDSTRARMRSYGGDPGMDHIVVSFIPLLRQVGVGIRDIEQFTVGNPARALSIKKA